MKPLFTYHHQAWRSGQGWLYDGGGGMNQLFKSCGALMLTNSQYAGGILRSPASYICHALSVTCTSAAQSLWVRFCAARNALTASALGKSPEGLRFGWLLTFRGQQRTVYFANGETSVTVAVNKSVFTPVRQLFKHCFVKQMVVINRAVEAINCSDDFCHFLNFQRGIRDRAASMGFAFAESAEVCRGSHFISLAPVPRGAVGSDFAAMCLLYMNIVRKSSYFIGVNPRNCNNREEI